MGILRTYFVFSATVQPRPFAPSNIFGLASKFNFPSWRQNVSLCSVTGIRCRPPTPRTRFFFYSFFFNRPIDLCRSILIVSRRVVRDGHNYSFTLRFRGSSRTCSRRIFRRRDLGFFKTIFFYQIIFLSSFAGAEQRYTSITYNTINL